MPSKSLSKISKHVVKKKGAKATALHENSRDSQRLQRAAARDDKLNRLANARSKQNQPFLQRVGFFRDAAQERIADEPFTLDEISSLINDFIHRADEELAELKAARRAGRPPTTREQQLKEQQAQEEKEFVSGYWVPDVTDVKTLTYLKNWNEEWISCNNMDFIRISKTGHKQDSTWPPKGLS
ncbi:hypothetical protein K490DRAFT_42499 [Saccharata proteae CBS 121410]|uniref:Translation machinery-associated protein 16 n=1 Tax=Saccharata proteae CBS 121410 TaxID=1314787 RepID=A0A9P4HUQ5_9PEZI|nr:hypothetical protein K490DRAFT_42499 [Saccharata proteae CBS 121410]